MALKSWDRVLKADNVIESLRPLTYISCVSLAPFRLNLNVKNKMYIPKYTFVVGIVYFLTYLCYNFGIARVSPVTNTVIFAIFGFAIIMRQKLVSIMQKIMDVDEILGSLGIRIKYQHILRFNFVTSIALMIFFVIFLGVQVRYFLDSWSDFFLVTIDVVVHFNVILFVFKYVCMTHLAEILFTMINEVLHDILEAQTALELSPIHSGVNGTSIIRQNPEYAIKQISNIQNMLCDICKTIEEYFEYPLLATIALSCLDIILATYRIAIVLFNPSSTNYENEMQIIGFSTEALWYIVIIFVIVEASTRTIGQSKSSATIVHKILNITDDPKLKDRLLYFSLQLTHRKISFTPAGLINLDRKLLLTFVSAVICYNLLLVKFYPEHFKVQNDDNNHTDYIYCLQQTDKDVPSFIKIAANLTDSID